MVKERLEYIDILRGIAIFLVVFGHLPELQFTNGTFVKQLIFSFHMPLFICISGFVSAYVYHDKLCVDNRKKGWGKFIVKKFMAIMVPYFAWCLIVVPFFFSSYQASFNYWEHVKEAIINNQLYWYLPCLFGLLICYAIYKYIRENFGMKRVWQEIVIIAALLCVVAAAYKITKIDCLRSILSYYVPFWVGIFMGQYKNFHKNFVSNSTLFGFCLIAFCLIVGLFMASPKSETGKIVRIITGLLSLPISFYIVYNIKFPERISNWFSKIGKETLGIYLIHFCLLGNLSWLVLNNIVLELTVYGAISTIAIVICTLIIKVLSQSGWVAKIMLGNSR